MIDLHQFPISSRASVPNYSPFCAKLECFLRAEKLEYRSVWFKGPPSSGAPKGKLPFVTYKGRQIPDSEFIIEFLIKEFDLTTDQHLSPSEKARAHAFKKLVEDHLCWIMVYERWCSETNWSQVKPVFLKGVPKPVQLLVGPVLHRKMKKALWTQGMGRHSEEERMALLHQGLEALSVQLDDAPYFFGQAFTTLDAAAFGLLSNLIRPGFTPNVQQRARQFANLVAYVDRLMAKYFPERQE